MGTATASFYRGWTKIPETTGQTLEIQKGSKNPCLEPKTVLTYLVKMLSMVVFVLIQLELFNIGNIFHAFFWFVSIVKSSQQIHCCIHHSKVNI